MIFLKSAILISLWLLARPLLKGRPRARRTLGIYAFVGSLAIPVIELYVPRQIVANLPRESVPNTPWLTYIWIIGVALCLANLASAWISMRKLLPQSRVVGYQENIPVREYNGDAVFTAGILSPSIILPTNVENRTPILQHELAHIAGRDLLWQTLAYMVCSLAWFNPILWIARTKLAEDCEAVADAAVLESGTTPVAYAEILHSLAKGAPRVALGIRGSGLSQRIAQILNHKPEKPAHLLPPFALALTLLVAPADVGLRSEEWFQGFNAARRYNAGERQALERAFIEHIERPQ